jgi:hypothetical protein
MVHTAVIPVSGRLKWEDLEFEVNLATYADPVSKTTTITTKRRKTPAVE